MVMRIITLHDPHSLAMFAARHIADLLGVQAGKRVNLALSGGGTPHETYHALRSRDVDWKRVDLWLGDERWVPHHHEDSNTRMVQESLANHVPARLHPVPWNEDLGPEEAAHRYAMTLDSFIDRVDGQLAPDIALLGIGNDGHTASLFPDTPALGMNDRDYVAQFVAAKESWRLTATPRLLHGARHLVFLVSGAGKADALRQILDGSDPPLPARLVADGAADVTWLVDESAAAQLGDRADVERPDF